MPSSSPYISALPPEFSKNAKLFEELLRQDQTVQAHVLDVFKNGDVFLFLEGQTLQAKTSLLLTKGDNITAKVTSIKPNLVLSILPQTKVPSIQEKALLSDLNQFRDKLVKMNVIPSQETLVAAKAYVSEGLPLQADAFKTFLNTVKNLGISDSTDISMAAKLQRFSLPQTLPMLTQIKTIFSESTKEPSLTVNEWLAETKNASLDLPETLRGKIRTFLNNVESMLKQNKIEPQSNPQDIETALQNTAHTSPFVFEKNLMTSISQKFLNENTLKEKLPEILQITRQAIQQAETISTNLHAGNKLSNLLLSLEKEFLFMQKAISEKTVSNPMFPSDQNSLSTTLLRTIHLLDQVRSTASPSSSNIKMQEISETHDELHSLFKTLFSDKISPPVFQDGMDPTQDAFPRSRIIPEGQGPISPPNIKEEINNFLQTLKEHISSPNLTSELKVQKVQEDTETLLNHILQKQFMAHTADDSLKMQSLDVPLVEKDQTSELNLQFKQQTTQGKNGETQKSFQVFFSMDLSHLGYFEIDIHDNQQNVDIAFASPNEDVSAFFKINSATLKNYLNQPPIKSVNVKTRSKKKSTPLQTNADGSSLSFKMPFRLDVTG